MLFSSVPLWEKFNYHSVCGTCFHLNISIMQHSHSTPFPVHSACALRSSDQVIKDTWNYSPWYNCTGWLGVKHQVVYLPETSSLKLSLQVDLLLFLYTATAQNFEIFLLILWCACYVCIIPPFLQLPFSPLCLHLQSKLASMSNDFKQVLEVRTEVRNGIVGGVLAV